MVFCLRPVPTDPQLFHNFSTTYFPQPFSLQNYPMKILMVKQVVEKIYSLLEWIFTCSTTVFHNSFHKRMCHQDFFTERMSKPYRVQHNTLGRETMKRKSDKSDPSSLCQSDIKRQRLNSNIINPEVFRTALVVLLSIQAILLLHQIYLIHAAYKRRKKEKIRNIN